MPIGYVTIGPFSSPMNGNLDGRRNALGNSAFKVLELYKNSCRRVSSRIEVCKLANAETFVSGFQFKLVGATQNSRGTNITAAKVSST